MTRYVLRWLRSLQLWLLALFNRSAHEIVPLAPKGLLNPFHRCDQYIFLPGFDLLQGTQMKVAEFSQALLGHAIACTHAPH